MTQTDIVLSTLNARYIHSSLGLRYLKANLEELEERACLLEFEIKRPTLEIVEKLLERDPQIIALGVYIWNVRETQAVIEAIRKLKPEIVVVLGGPEVSYETKDQAIVQLSDYVIQGEGDFAFRDLARQILNDQAPANKIIAAGYVDVTRLKLPYRLYTDEDIAHRVIYVEASRGCPFTCEFCLSSMDIPVRTFDLDSLLQEFEQLMKRGVTQFKFVDRTFNLSIKASQTILHFFQERYFPGMFLHFELIPDRLPKTLREIIANFPAGALQFEVGIQTFNPDVADLIKRRQNYQKLEENLHYLRENTEVHIHADLIAGLPGESIKSFAKGFDQLVKLRPQEIQLGILKRLKGTPIVRHDQRWQMRYHETAPFELLSNKDISFSQMMQIRRTARTWDLIINNGNFHTTAPMLWKNGSAFFATWDFSHWLFQKTGSMGGIALTRLQAFLFEYLTEIKSCPHKEVAQSLIQDYRHTGHYDTPPFLRKWINEPTEVEAIHLQTHAAEPSSPKRQQRHHPPSFVNTNEN
ncbi:MAG: radical SAM protein [Verrucomicrobiota bacterium]